MCSSLSKCNITICSYNKKNYFEAHAIVFAIFVAQLRTLFEDIGAILSIKIRPDYADVVFENKHDAQEVVAQLGGSISIGGIDMGLQIMNSG